MPVAIRSSEMYSFLTSVPESAGKALRQKEKGLPPDAASLRYPAMLSIFRRQHILRYRFLYIFQQFFRLETHVIAQPSFSGIFR